MKHAQFIQGCGQDTLREGTGGDEDFPLDCVPLATPIEAVECLDVGSRRPVRFCNQSMIADLLQPIRARPHRQQIAEDDPTARVLDEEVYPLLFLPGRGATVYTH